MNSLLSRLIEAEEKAKILFQEVEKRQLTIAGKSEKELNKEVFSLAEELFGIRKFWHKRIVRSGSNTLLPYRHNPPDLILQEDDILFFDFGPVFEDFEADLGRTYVIGQNETKLKLQKDVELAWQKGKEFYLANRDELTGAQFYAYIQGLARTFGWEYGNEHCGHLVGNFPHEKLLGEDKINYLHPENHTKLSDCDKLGNQRFWILEIHFIDPVKQIGGFYEQLLYEE